MRLAVDFVYLVALLASGLPSGVLASTASRDLVARGAIDLSQDKFGPALASFEAAAKADPTDAEAVYFQSLTLNRTGKHADALAALDRVAAMGYAHRDVALERGWALVGVGRWDEGITELNTFEAAEPGRGQTSLLLGQAYRGKGTVAQAEASFKEAARRDPTLVGQTTKLLADLNSGGAALNPGPGTLAGTQSPRTSSLRSQLQGVGATATSGQDAALTWSRRTRGSAGFAAGNNSNVISLGDATLAGEITSSSDTFIQMFADLSWDWQFNAKDGLTLGYFGQVNNYDTLSAFDLTDHIGYATFRRLFRPDLQGTLSVADNFTELGGLPFRNVVSLRPALSWLLKDGDTLEAALYFSRNNYFFDTLPQFDRDGDTTSASLTHFFHIKDTRFTGRIGYYHLWNSARGSDFDFNSDGMIVGLNHPIGTHGTNISGFYSHTWDDYDNLNSLTALTLARRDETDRFSLQVSVPVRRQLKVFGRYEHTEVDSNVGAFTFDQDTISGGLVATF